MHHPGFGALVISLDFELHWGVRDTQPAGGPYDRDLRGAREAVPRILDLFEEFDTAATWATVGFLFASSRAQIEKFAPTLRPAYDDSRLSPYAEAIGESEQDDPLHFAASLIQEIRRRPRQEIGSHTFSHFYCREPGQTRDAFEADLRSAVAIAAANGIQLRSLVFPRNQRNSQYLSALRAAGFWCYRGTEPGWLFRRWELSDFPERRWKRALRQVDSYADLSGSNVLRWEGVMGEEGLCNVAATRFLRPYNPRLRHLEPLRLARVLTSVREAARSRAIAHVWWHPHNFGRYTEQNLAFLRKVLEGARSLSTSDGLRSLSMADVARIARGGRLD